MSNRFYDATEGEFIDFATLEDWELRDKAKDARIEALTAERDALAEKLEKAGACLEEIKLDCMERAKIDRRGVSTVPISNGTWETLRATIAQITGCKTDDHTD